MNKKYLVAGALGLLILVGGYFLFFANKSSDETTPMVAEQNIPTISAESIGLTLKPGSDGKRVIMTVTKTDDIDSLEYELFYSALGDRGTRITQTAIGNVEVKKGQTVNREIYLGTCSAVCHPDKEVKDIRIVVRVNKSDGKVYQAEATTEL